MRFLILISKDKSRLSGQSLLHAPLPLIDQSACATPSPAIDRESDLQQRLVATKIEAILENSGVQQLQLVVDAIMDENFKIFVGECENTGNKKYRCLNKKSIFKGVSKNGSKWQVSRYSTDTVDHGHGGQPEVFLALVEVRNAGRPRLRPLHHLETGHVGQDQLQLHACTASAHA